jgi:hypothetical protein
MSYTVKLAIFPLWKAPVPYTELAGTFATTTEAAEAGIDTLASITERELADLVTPLHPRAQRAGEQWGAVIDVPYEAVHGYLIYDEAGVEVFNWTTLDIALDRAAES